MESFITRSGWRSEDGVRGIRRSPSHHKQALYQLFSHSEQIPGMFFSNQNSAADWNFRTEPENACLAYEDGCVWPRGKMLGGSHGMNAMLYIRGHDRDYDQWEALGNPTWNYETVLKYFKKSEANQNLSFVEHQDGKYHGNKGYLIVDKYGEPDSFSKIFLDAGKEIGYEFVDDLNREHLLGYAYAQGTIHKGFRQSVAKTFLGPAKDRPNLHVIKHAHATRILFNGNDASGVEFIYNGTHKMRAINRKEIVLSAGAVSSPPLLMLSGIGPKEHLQKFNIPVTVDAAVGKSLQDHVIARVFLGFHRSSPEKETLLDLLDQVYNFAIHKTGRLTGIGTSDLVAFVNTQNGTGYPDIELHFLSFKKNSLEFEPYLDLAKVIEPTASALLEHNKHVEIGVIYVILLNPKSAGRIELNSASSTDPPKIFANYFADDDDMETLLRGVKQQVDLTETKTYRKHEGEFLHLPIPACDQYAFKSDDYLRCYIRHFSCTLFHPTSTSKMGPDTDPDAVVDHRLRVKGVNRLRQADAGIMPVIVSANTNAATIMIGERAADFIKEDWNDAPIQNQGGLEQCTHPRNCSKEEL